MAQWLERGLDKAKVAGSSPAVVKHFNLQKVNIFYKKVNHHSNHCCTAFSGFHSDSTLVFYKIHKTVCEKQKAKKKTALTDASH